VAGRLLISVNWIGSNFEPNILGISGLCRVKFSRRAPKRSSFIDAYGEESERGIPHMETTISSRVLRVMREALGRRNDQVDDEEGAEGGFTLIELMVVLLIMAILMAIAIPTFLGVKGGAQNRAAQSDITNALTSAKAVYTNLGTYGSSGSLVASLQASEPEMTFTTAAVNTTSGAHWISAATSTDGAILILGTQANNGTCWFGEDNEEATAINDGMTNATTSQGISYASSVGPMPSGGTCNAAAPKTAAGAAVSNWNTSYPAS